jgi:hypothetical protein
LDFAVAVALEVVVGAAEHAGGAGLPPVAGKALVAQGGALAGFNKGKPHPVAGHLGPVDAALVGRYVDAVYRVAGQQRRFFAARETAFGESGPSAPGVAVYLNPMADVVHGDQQQPQ